MPFAIPILAAIGGGSALAGGAIAAGTAASAYGAISSANSAKKAAQNAATSSQVDIAALDEQVRKIARQNALDSAALEKELTPEVPQLRTAANQGIIAGLTPSQSDNDVQDMLSGSLGQNIGTNLAAPGASVQNIPLLRDAIAKAKSDLGLGGRLDQETQNAVTRSSLARSGSVTGGLGLGRDVTARDLGLTSLGIANDRLSRASALGQVELGANNADRQFGLANAQLGLSAGIENNNTAFRNAGNTLQTAQLLSNNSNNAYNRFLQAGIYGQGIAQPIVGLDPTAIANLTSGNATNAGAAQSNLANIYGARSNSYLNLAGSLVGKGFTNVTGGG